MILWSIITAIFLIIIKFAHDASQRSHVRTEAERNPKSLAYFTVKLFDYLYAKTIFKNITFQREANPPAEKPPLSSSEYLGALHDYIGVKDLFEVRQSFTITFDVGKRLSRRKIVVFGNPANQIIAKTVIYFVALNAVIIPILLWFQIDLAITIIIALISWFVLFMFHVMKHGIPKGDTVFGSLEKLYWQSYIIISIDKRSIFITSSWNKTVARNTEDLRFEKIATDFTLGIALQGMGKTLVLCYPRILDNVILNELELSQICDRLNEIMQQVRGLPESLEAQQKPVLITVNPPSPEL
jgi:hypothetical protein